MRELVGLLDRFEVEFALVGGFAVNYYGYPRTTQDIDLLVLPSAQNAARAMNALAAFGFGDAGIPKDTFEHEGSAVHLGVEPNRIDLLTSLKGVDNEAIFRATRRVEMDGLEIPIISLDHLVTVKLASERLRDLADAEELERIRHSQGGET